MTRKARITALIPIELPSDAEQVEKATVGRRFIPMIGDSMEPTIGARDLVGVVLYERFDCDGLYVLDVRGHPTVYRCQWAGGDKIDVWFDNPVYRGVKDTLSRYQFNKLCIGAVFGILHMQRSHLVGL